MRADTSRWRLPAWASMFSPRVRGFSDAGLLDGLSGAAKHRRAALLLRLADGGVSTPELVKATADGRLGHLVMKDALSPRGRMYTLEEISALAGLSIIDVERWFRAMGRGVSSRITADFSEDDLRLARVLVEYRRLGIDENGLFASARILGRNLWAAADAIESLVDMRLTAAAERPEVALRLAVEVTRVAEFQASILAHVVASRFQSLAMMDEGNESSSAAGDIAVCFVDIVGFTSLGERASPTELAQLAERLDDLTTGAVEIPVRFVKTVGDAVMLISPDPNALADTVLRIFAAARTHDLPQLHAGLAWGPALPSAGDWIGRTVNLASRIAAIARPDVILIDQAMRDHLDPTVLQCDSAGSFLLKGYGNERELYQLIQ